MDILIIGNGFDLAHKLPTTYIDFLHFFHHIKANFHSPNCSNTLDDIFFNTYPVNNYVKNYIKNVCQQCNSSSEENNNHKSVILMQELCDKLDDNIWYNYLWIIYIKGKMKGINWIDFESEISHIIEQIDRYQENLYQPFNIQFETTLDDKMEIFLEQLKQTEKNFSTCREFLDNSYCDLERFIRCMEIYLIECVDVEQFPISYFSPDIKEILPHAVLCFNYTHTYTKVYSKTPCIHFIHGETHTLDTPNNMILGIDEYYHSPEKDLHTNYNIYKKFTQRILKETGFLYNDWIYKMNSITPKLDQYPKSQDTTSDFLHNVYIFGHSLDVTDKDVLMKFIDRKDVKTTVFYYDKQQQTQQIANLVKMLGQDKFISMINNVPRQICFKHQQNMVSNKACKIIE